MDTNVLLGTLAIVASLLGIGLQIYASGKQKQHDFMLQEYRELLRRLIKIHGHIQNAHIQKSDIDNNVKNEIKIEIVDIGYRMGLNTTGKDKKVQVVLGMITQVFAKVINEGYSLGDIDDLNCYIYELVPTIEEVIKVKFTNEFKQTIEELFPCARKDSNIPDQTTLPVADVMNAQENQVEEQIDQTEKNYVWINTNSSYHPNAYEKMIENGVACTYGPESYGNALGRVRHGDNVLLYHSGRGIIAYGTVDEPQNPTGGQGAVQRKTEPPITTDYDDTEYQVKVNWEIPQISGDQRVDLNVNVSASKIRECGHNMFVRTVQYLPQEVGEKIVNVLRSKVVLV